MSNSEPTRGSQPDLDPAAPAPAVAAVAVAASTGGPSALARLIADLPADFPAAVIVIQHIPAFFTRSLTARLNGLTPLPVCQAVPGELVRSGTVYLAPGGAHLGLVRTPAGVVFTAPDGDPVGGLRPTADLLFHAVASHFGPAGAGVVLTGMGRDGAEGMRAIREAGGWTVAQDEASATMGSMPRAAAAHAQLVLPLSELGAAVVARMRLLARRAQA